MIHNKKPFTCLLLLTLLSFFCIKTKADPIYVYHNCTNTSTFIPNSLYQTNLNHLLSSLSSNSTKNEFSTVTTGQGASAVYGLFLCRGDVGAKVCQDCVNFATKDIVKRCPGDKEAIIWYDKCFLRFSNRSFFGTVDELPRVSLLNIVNVKHKQWFSQAVLLKMNETAAEAAKGGVGQKKYAIKDANFTKFLVQCTPDLSSSNCSRCLWDAIKRLPVCCDGKQGGRVMFPSCNVRYEIYPFFNTYPATPRPDSLKKTKGKSKMRLTKIVTIVIPIIVCMIIFIFGFYYLVKRSKKKYSSMKQENDRNEITTESLQFDLATIASATNEFFVGNKLGKGGFGVVYKGTLPNGQEIAVKRLSKKSGQGEEEFKNEVLVVAKLQHRNLVRLLGFCLEGGEKLLVFEYVPNTSLDAFLYHPEKQGQLDWSRRYKIITGIARGILYLHEESRLRIIHRDLKASNVLLDVDMNPKISDFGMARIFGVDQTQGNTSRIVGTYGYMAPEYAIYGQFSIKSDVYSFGVLLLEIISGKKNNSFYQSDFTEDFLSYAWKLWKEGKPLKLLDLKLKDCYSENEVVRCIRIGLLCVQKDPEDRPTMKLILTMLNSSVTLPSPQPPAFYIPSGTEGYLREEMPLSINEASISEFYPR